MSKAILIMDMPERCKDCDAYVCYKQYAGDPGDEFCGMKHEEVNGGEKPDWCPLRELPEKQKMGRLIDADELVKLLRASTMSNGTLINTNTMLAIVEKMPTAYDVDKVVAELQERMIENSDGEYNLQAFDAYDDAIEIVRKGGGTDICVGSNHEEEMLLIEDVLDTLVEVGNGVTDEQLHEAADKLFKVRHILKEKYQQEGENDHESNRND